MNAENVVKEFSQPHIGGGKKKLKNDIEAILGIVVYLVPSRSTIFAIWLG